MADEPTGFAGVRLRAGLPQDNGISPLADDLVGDTTRIVHAVVAYKVRDVVQHVERQSSTVVMQMLGIEADLSEDEMHAVRLIFDRARVRRTGEQPMFDAAGEPESPLTLVTEQAEPVDA